MPLMFPPIAAALTTKKLTPVHITIQRTVLTTHDREGFGAETPRSIGSFTPSLSSVAESDEDGYISGGEGDPTAAKGYGFELADHVTKAFSYKRSSTASSSSIVTTSIDSHLTTIFLFTSGLTHLTSTFTSVKVSFSPRIASLHSSYAKVLAIFETITVFARIWLDTKSAKNGTFRAAVHFAATAFFVLMGREILKRITAVFMFVCGINFFFSVAIGVKTAMLMLLGLSGAEVYVRRIWTGEKKVVQA